MVPRCCEQPNDGKIPAHYAGHLFYFLHGPTLTLVLRPQKKKKNHQPGCCCALLVEDGTASPPFFLLSCDPHLHVYLKYILQVNHSAFNEGDFRVVSGMAILPLKTKVKGPAPQGASGTLPPQHSFLKFPALASLHAPDLSYLH
jgi:hypothetical protein